MLVKYMKTHIKSFILLAVFALSMVVVMMIFGIDLRPVFYGLVVCAFVGGALAVYDYSAFRESTSFLPSQKRRFPRQ